MIEIRELVKLPELPVIEMVDDLGQVYKEFMIIRAALQLRLFDWMAAKGPATIEEISDGTGVSRDYIAPLIGLLFYLDITRRSGEKYLLSPSANLHFVTTSNYYQGDVILALAGDQSPWKDLQTYLTRPDKKSSFEPETGETGAARAEQEVRGMVRNITTVISRWAGFKNAGSFLEIGTGHGLYAIAACQIHLSLKATVCVKPENADLLHHNISRYGMEERITVSSEEPGSLSTGAACDIILASHVLYDKQDRLPEIIRNMAASLRNEGLFISNHWFSRESEGTGMQGLYELELGLHNRYHTIRDRECFENICREEGLGIFQTGIMRSMYGESTVHMATKTTENLQ